MPTRAPSTLGRALRVAVAALVLTAFVLTLARGAGAIFASTPSAVAITLTIVGMLGALYFVLTVYHALRYRPVAPPGDDELPTLTVIVPAYNEGAAVRIALESALASDYPEEKLRVIAIDDGSADDTWEHIEAVARRARGRVLALRQPRNMGKREALRRGFLLAESEMLVTVDSDSKIARDALRAIVAPLVESPEVGAVAGRVTVLNRDASLLTRLLDARFVLTFDLSRAAQSRFGAVLCTPGALSAYRASGVREVLDRWSTQTFLGRACTIAEDRALTTWLLRAGYRAVYQRSAAVETIVPTTLARVARMLVRWERGNIREDLVMLPLLFTRWRERDRFWPSMEILLELVQYPIAWLGLGLVIAHAIAHPTLLLTVLASALLGALVQSLYCLRSERGSDFVYSVGYALFAFVALQWVFPYSLLTVRDGRWLTR